MRAVEGAELPGALCAALAGGEPVIGLPTDPVERDRLLGWLADLDAPLAEGTAAVVATSGSTGGAKAVMLSGDAIRASVTATHERLGGPGDWLLTLPGHYVAGLMVIARSVVADTRLVPIRPDLADLEVGRSDGRRYLSLVPTQLSRALGNPALAAALADLDAVLLGGGPADPTLLAAAEARSIRVVTTYGMSETCGGCVYDGVPLAGTEVELDAAARISIAGSTLFSGYWGDPVRTDETLINGRLVTADRGRWSAGRLEVLGRVDDVVITSGHKVDLAEVERCADRWAGDLGGSGVVLGLPDADLGTMIVAAVDVDADLATMHAALGQQLPRHALPRRLVRLDRLPRLASGKPDRVSITEAVR